MDVPYNSGNVSMEQINKSIEPFLNLFKKGSDLSFVKRCFLYVFADIDSTILFPADVLFVLSLPLSLGVEFLDVFLENISFFRGDQSNIFHPMDRLM